MDRNVLESLSKKLLWSLLQFQSSLLCRLMFPRWRWLRWLQWPPQLFRLNLRLMAMAQSKHLTLLPPRNPTTSTQQSNHHKSTHANVPLTPPGKWSKLPSLLDQPTQPNTMQMQISIACLLLMMAESAWDVRIASSPMLMENARSFLIPAACMTERPVTAHLVILDSSCQVPPVRGLILSANPPMITVSAIDVTLDTCCTKIAATTRQTWRKISRTNYALSIQAMPA